MSKKLTAAKAAVLAGAVVASTLSVTAAHAADATFTKVAPNAPVKNGVAQLVTITGTGLTSAVKRVEFSTGSADPCVGTDLVVVSATKATVKLPTTGCTAGAQTVRAWSALEAGTKLAEVVTKLTLVDPVGTADAVVSPASGVAGTAITVTGLVGLPATGFTAWLGGKPVTGLKRVSATSFTGKAGAGVKPSRASLVVKTGAIESAAKANAFTFLPVIKVTPSVWVKGATAPVLKIENFAVVSSASVVKVTVCGVTATKSATKASTATVLYYDAPSWDAIGKPDGTACVVKVSADVLGNNVLVPAVDAVEAVEAVEGSPFVAGHPAVEHQDAVPGTPEVPAVVDPDTGEIITPAVPATEGTPEVLAQDAVADQPAVEAVEGVEGSPAVPEHTTGTEEDMTSVVTATSVFVYAAY